MAKKILVVDDSSTIRQLVATALAAAGYVVLEAADGVGGLERLREQPDVSLVLCDVNMPRMNGIAMLTNLKAADVTAKTPVVMLTTEDDPDLVERARSAGAKAWIVKPFKSESLVATVRKLAGPP
jgi:two-component system chemotaxis response regulator CheY